MDSCVSFMVGGDYWEVGVFFVGYIRFVRIWGESEDWERLS